MSAEAAQTAPQSRPVAGAHLLLERTAEPGEVPRRRPNHNHIHHHNNNDKHAKHKQTTTS